MSGGIKTKVESVFPLEAGSSPVPRGQGLPGVAELELQHKVLVCLNRLAVPRFCPQKAAVEKFSKQIKYDLRGDN